jgi:formylglycine-generating enzyme required for sulfatase activity
MKTQNANLAAETKPILTLMKMNNLFGRASRYCGMRAAIHAVPLLLFCLLAGIFPARAGSPPVVSNVTAAQQAGTKDVNISYTINDPDSSSVSISILVSKDSGETWTVPAVSFSGTGAPSNNVPANATYTIVWHAGTDWNGHYTANCRVRVIATDFETGLTLIPAGSYLRGNPPALGDTDISDAPQYSVNVSTFYMDANLVSGGFWNLIKDGYADSHGYQFDHPGTFIPSSNPVTDINWYDAVKWCNARSEMEGLTPCYYTDASLSTVYRSGDIDLQNSFVKWNANGYRLPTETEWEKGARGGLTGWRFPWQGQPGFPMGAPPISTISESQANYLGDSEDFDYDFGPDGYNSTYNGPSPVGSYPPNNYGFYDMAGNVWEWCWDGWDGSTPYDPSLDGTSDPEGAGFGLISTAGPQYQFSDRVQRGGAWETTADFARCAYRSYYQPTGKQSGNDPRTFGFRCVRRP